MLRIKLLAVLFITLMTSSVFAEEIAVYDAQTGSLHIPKVKVAGDTSETVYSVDMVDLGGWNFGLSSVENAPLPTLADLVISGGTQVSKSGSLQLTALALSGEGVWTDVTSSATWSQNSSAISSLVYGQVRTGFVSHDQQATIRASYNVGSVTRSSTHEITVTANRISRLYLEMINADSSTLGEDPLVNQPNDGFTFQLGDTTYDVSSAQMQRATNYHEFVVALESKLSSLGLSDIISVALGEIFTYAHPSTFESVNGTTVVLVCNSQETIRAIGFSNASFDPTVTFISRIF